MNTMRMMFLAAALAMAGSCAKETTDQPTPTDQPTTPTSPPAPAEIPDQELPVATDFEDEAEKQISAENYKAELDTLEQEIAAE
ncbi:MAG TPA: hypothetical protein VNM90_21030 [Haliangium sp.]|nr:hypothetical protein [Haliangium sp.]